MTSIQKKLRLQPGHRALILNSPAEYSELLGSSPEGVEFTRAGSKNNDFVHLFVRNRTELDRFIDGAMKSLKAGGLLWISYPKGSSKVPTDVNRDSLWERLKAKNIRPVTQIAIDETWSAMRFMPAGETGA